MPRKSWREALATYANPATLALLLLGFAAGLPYMLVFSTLSVWLREAGVARETIGFASLIGLAYAFKWVWAPMLDQWRLPLLGKLGRRRSWLVLAQGLVAIGPIIDTLDQAVLAGEFDAAVSAAAPARAATMKTAKAKKAG